MLLSFSVSNFKGFKDTAFLTLNEATSESASKCRATYSGKDNLGYVSHVAGIFGANGAGKSSLIDALHYAHHLVIESATSYTQGEELYFAPHIFDEACHSTPSEYEFIFKTNASVFRYGFSHDAQKICAEWLYEVPLALKKRQRTWFTRTFDTEASDSYEWYINGDYIQHGTRLKKGTRQNALFLSSAVRDNCESLEDLFFWFKKKLHIFRSNQRLGFKTTARNLLSDKSGEIKALLKEAGILFDDINVKERELSKDDFAFPDDAPQELKNLLIKELDGKKDFDIKFVYKIKTDEPVSLSLADESDGTQALFALAYPLIDVLQQAATLVVDELHNNLHPNLLRHVVSLFNNQSNSEGAGQLIFSSHDTSILSPIELSEDQIWFVEKDNLGQSTSHSLKDYSGLRSSNYAKMYRDGRFGAIPEIIRRL